MWWRLGPALNRREFLAIGGATVATLSTAASLSAAEDQEDVLPEYSQWLTVDDDGAVGFVYLDTVVVDELSNGVDLEAEADGEDGPVDG